MFKLIQTDPETSAIHVNVGAIERHKYRQSLLACLAAVSGGQSHELMRLLFRLPDSHEKAFSMAFTSMMVHELKHHMDLLLTPYGFHRLRTAFSFYTIGPSILDRIDIILPVSQGMDEFNQKRFGMESYSTSQGYFLSQLISNRNNIIAKDNEAQTVRDRLTVQYGGDAIMESLAFTYQAEMLQHGAHKSPYLRQIMPYAFVTDDGDESSLETEEHRQREIRYKWHYVLLNLLSPTPNIATIRILNVILFACLCGSFVKGAIPRFATFGGIDLKPASELKVRDVDDSLPSRRLDALIRWVADYLEPRKITEITWEDAWALVNQGHEAIWDTSIVDEVEKDIEHDRILQNQIAAATVEILPSDGSPQTADALPHLAFADLLEIRSKIFAAFKADPVRFVRPLDFTALTDELGCAPLCYISPFGADEPFNGSVPVVTRRVLVPAAMVPPAVKGTEAGHEQDSAWAADLVYSSFKMKSARAFSGLHVHKDAWATTLAVLAPLYKLSLYGLRYRTMLELDMVDAVNMFRRSSPNIKWDPFYLRVDDTSSAEEYFHFYDLRRVECDLCSKSVTENDALVVSAATLRRSKKFRDEQLAQHGEYARFMSLGRDWSPWLVCRACHSSFVSDGMQAEMPERPAPVMTHTVTNPDIDDTAGSINPDEGPEASGIHDIILNLIINDDVPDAEFLRNIDDEGTEISFFVSTLRRNFGKTVNFFQQNRYEEVLAIWNPWENNALLNPDNGYWRDKPYFSTMIRSVVVCLFVSHAQIGQSENSLAHASITVDLLSRVVPGSAVSSQWIDDFPLTLEECQIQDENFLVALDFAQDWLSGWSPDLLIACGVVSELAHSVGTAVEHTQAEIRRALQIRA